MKVRPLVRIDPSSLEASLRENFKLSSYEARAYIALLKLGRQNPKQVSSRANIPMPRVYDTLDSLMEKGFLSKEDDYYLAVAPKRALHGRSLQFQTLFERERKLRVIAEDELSEALEIEESHQRKVAPEDQEKISILRGFNSIANAFSELLEKSQDIFLLAKRAVEAKDVFIPLMLEYGGSNEGTNRVKKRKRIRIIVPNDVEVTEDDISKAKEAGVEIRRTDHILFDMMIADEENVIIGVPDPLSDEINHAIAIWVRNSSFASSTRNSAEEIWKASRSVS